MGQREGEESVASFSPWVDFEIVKSSFLLRMLFVVQDDGRGSS
jgi:hypothetical protein